jgi:YHS domain-containing protein
MTYVASPQSACMGFLDKLKGKDAAAPGGKVTDPVCGMTIEPKNAAGSSQHAGKTVYFCSASCKGKFDANPAAYAAKL